MGKNVWVSPDIDGWKVHREGEINGKVYPTKEKAVSVGISMGRQEASELTIQRKDGVIQEKRSYKKRSR